MLTLASMLPLQEYRSAWGVSPRAVLLCGDCNGSHRGRVGSYLRSQVRGQSYNSCQSSNQACI